MTNQIESPDGRPRKDNRPSPDTRGVADGATGKTVDNRTPDGQPPKQQTPVTPTDGQVMAD
jgi:hypothetical protein